MVVAIRTIAVTIVKVCIVVMIIVIVCPCLNFPSCRACPSMPIVRVPTLWFRLQQGSLFEFPHFGNTAAM